MKRVIVSTLASEAQAFLLGIRELEWVLAQVMEILAGLQDFSRREVALKVIPSAGVTDAKSLYDSLIQPTSANIQDREAGLDVICVKQILARTGTTPRWAPGTLNVADVLTKDVGSAADLFRSCVRSSSYTLASEEEMLQQRASERERRQQKSPEPSRKVEGELYASGLLRVMRELDRTSMPLDTSVLGIMDEFMGV